MRFALPDSTVRNVGLVIARPEVVVSSEKPGGREPEGVWTSHQFAVGIPGELGEYAGVRLRAGDPRMAPRLPKELVVPRRDAPIDFRGGDAGRGMLLAQELIHSYRADPVAYFMGLPYRADLVRDYVGAASWMRAQAKAAVGGHGGDLIEWSDIGWTTAPRLARYQEARGRLEGLIIGERKPASDALVLLREEGFDLPEWENVYRAAVAAGDLPAFDAESRGRMVGWDEVKGALLGMRLFTEEQVGLLVPWTDSRSLRYSLRGWATEGWVEAHRGHGLPMPVWKITEKAVEDGAGHGLMSRLEANRRRSVRTTQELHDLAVGDALILLGLDLATVGGEIEDLRTEISLMSEEKTGSFPDFKLTYRMGDRRRDVSVEVVGLGNNYRTAAKGGVARRSGFKVYSPGFDGYGARFV